VLDKCFENVCELDLIYHPDTANYILDEIIQGGMIVELNKTELFDAIYEQLGNLNGTSGVRTTNVIKPYPT
jgi:AP-3 complex subunit sigma